MDSPRLSHRVRAVTEYDDARYRLTDQGRALAPVLDAMATWGTTYVPGTRRLTG